MIGHRSKLGIVSGLLLLASQGLTPATLSPFPATFKGTLPCADCPGIEYHLNLFPDQVFFLRTTYLDRHDAVFDDIGTWALGSDQTTLALWGGRGAPDLWAVRDEATLAKLDRQGQPIESDLNYELAREEQLEALEPRLEMRGMYRYLADAALYEECFTGLKLPVAQEADNIALETAYLETRREPGQAILAQLEGSIAARPPMEGAGLVPTLIPEKFSALWPGETCGARQVIAELEGTRWVLVRLGEEPVIPTPGSREIDLVLVSEESRAQGFAGCNRLMGGYELDGSSLRFTALALTRMMCSEGMDKEQRFTQALEATARWRGFGQHLELYDQAGDLLARFEARNLE